MSETQLEIWGDDISDYSEDISDTISENYDDRISAQLDDLRTPQDERARAARDARDEAIDQIDADLEQDRDAVNDYKEKQVNAIRAAARDLNAGRDATWNGQAVSFNQLNINVCTEANPDPKNELNPNDPGKKWDDACDKKRAALAARKAQKPAKSNKKAYKKWQGDVKKLTADVKLCSVNGLQFVEKQLQSQLDALDRGKSKLHPSKRDAWRKKRTAVRKQLDAVKAAIRKAERYKDYAADENDYKEDTADAQKSREQCIEDANKSSADEWRTDQEEEVSDQAEDATESVLELADDRRQDVDEWYEETRTLIADVEDREKEDAQLDAEKLRRNETRAARQLETKTKALLRNIGR